MERVQSTRGKGLLSIDGKPLFWVFPECSHRERNCKSFRLNSVLRHVFDRYWYVRTHFILALNTLATSVFDFLPEQVHQSKRATLPESL